MWCPLVSSVEESLTRTDTNIAIVSAHKDFATVIIIINKTDY